MRALDVKFRVRGFRVLEVWGLGFRHFGQGLKVEDLKPQTARHYIFDFRADEPTS